MKRSHQASPQAENYSLDLSVLFCRADDVDAWGVHCLELDVITQGVSLGHAMDMAVEAIEMVVVDDLKVKRDPLSRRAPQEYFDELRRVLRAGKPVQLTPDQLKHYRDQSVVLASQLRVVIRRPVASAPKKTRRVAPKGHDLSTTWQGAMISASR